MSTKDFINIYRKCSANSYYFLANDISLAWDNPLRFRKFFLNIIKIMAINDLSDKSTQNKHPKYRLYHQVKFMNIKILLVKIYYHLINKK